MSTRIAPSAALAAAIEELLAEGLGDGERLAEIGRLGARLTLQRAVEEEATYWAALDEATSPAEGEPRLRRLVADLERAYPSAAACLAEDLPTLRAPRVPAPSPTAESPSSRCRSSRSQNPSGTIQGPRISTLGSRRVIDTSSGVSGGSGTSIVS